MQRCDSQAKAVRERADANGDFKTSRRLHRGLATMTGHISDGNNPTASIVSPSCSYAFQTKNQQAGHEQRTGYLLDAIGASKQAESFTAKRAPRWQSG
jgi:hypothetical protein